MKSLLHLHKPRGGHDDFPIGIFLLLSVLSSIVLHKVIVLAGELAGFAGFITEVRSAIMLLSVLVGLLISTIICEHLPR